MMVFGMIWTVYGFRTPSDTPVSGGARFMAAAVRLNSTTLFSVRMSCSAAMTGPRPHVSPGITDQRNTMTGLVSPKARTYRMCCGALARAIMKYSRLMGS